MSEHAFTTPESETPKRKAAESEYTEPMTNTVEGLIITAPDDNNIRNIGICLVRQRGCEEPTIYRFVGNVLAVTEVGYDIWREKHKEESEEG